MKNIKLIILMLVLFTALISCKKEEIREKKYYYGNIYVIATQFEDAPGLSIVFGEDTLGLIQPDSGNLYVNRTVEAGKSKHLKIYLTSTGQLVADTLLTVDKHKTTSLQYGYSERFGFKGFVGKTNVPADSIKARFLYNALEFENPHKEVELHFCNFFLEETGIVIKGLKKGDPVGREMTFPTLDGNGNPPSFFIKIKDVASGEFIKQKDTDSDLFLIFVGSTEQGGHYLFVSVDIGDQTNNFILPNIAVL